MGGGPGLTADRHFYRVFTLRQFRWDRQGDDLQAGLRDNDLRPAVRGEGSGRRTRRRGGPELQRVGPARHDRQPEDRLRAGPAGGGDGRLQTRRRVCRCFRAIPARPDIILIARSADLDPVVRGLRVGQGEGQFVETDLRPWPDPVLHLHAARLRVLG